MRLISARWLIPIATPPLVEGAVVVSEDADGATSAATPSAAGTILAVGTRADLRRNYPHLVEERAEGALCPGLVNAHAHLELSGMGDPVAGGDGIVNWTRSLVARLADQPRDAEAIRAAALQAVEAARSFGTAAIAEVGNGTAGWVALGRAGMPGVFFHELVGSREARTGDALADAARERADLLPGDRPTEVAAVAAPHAPYSVGAALMRRIFVAAQQAGAATTIHLAEDDDEIRLLRDGTGAWAAVLRSMGVAPEERSPGIGPVAYLQQLGAFQAGTPPPLLVHMVHADGDDRRRAREAHATVVLCPRSNLHIGGRLPDVPSFIDEGVRLAMGTDSLASVPDLSLWREIATLSAHFPAVPPRVWLHAATVGGASALGLRHLGALSPGKRPGLLDVVAAAGMDAERALVADGAPRIRWMDHGTNRPPRSL